MIRNSTVWFYVDGYRIPVLRYHEIVKQNTDFNGRPSNAPQGGIYRVVVRDIGRWTHLLDTWAIHPTMRKECRLEEMSFQGNKMLKTLEFLDTYCIHLEYIDSGDDEPFYVLVISAATVIRNGKVVISKKWRKVDPALRNRPVTEEVEEETPEPEIIKGWWSHDKAGKEVYDPDDEYRGKVALGKTVYFHIETRGIPTGDEVALQLYDFDHFFFIDEHNIDTSKFPNDPVKKTATVDNHGIATVELLLSQSWEPVIGDDHDDLFSLDQTIELYWKTAYSDEDNDIRKLLPRKKRNYLRVGYNKRDLFVKPAVSGSSLPEYYDKNGKLIIFAFKRAKDIAKALNTTSNIEAFVVTKIKISETYTLSQINTVKKSLYYESVNLATRNTKQYLYVTEEVSEFYIKGTSSFTDVKEFDIKRAKKFSEYFNKRDLSAIGTKGLAEGREILRFLDYVNVSKTLMSMFPKEGSTSLEVPKPSSTASIISTFATGEFTWALSGALSSLFMVSDVIATQEVNKIMNDVKGYNMELLEQAKLQGLEQLQVFMDATRTGELTGFRLIGDIPEETHFKVMRGEIETYVDFDESRVTDTGSDKYYSYLVKIIDDSSTERKTYIIDAVYDQ